MVLELWPEVENWRDRIQATDDEMQEDDTSSGKDKSSTESRVGKWFNSSSQLHSLESIKKELNEHISNVRGHWARAAPISHFQNLNPGLNLKKDGGDGTVPMPLSAHDAARIQKHASTRAHRVHDADGTTWELTVHDFELLNPAWEEYILALTDKATKLVGLNGAVYMLEKLILHGAGSDIQLHIEPETSDFHVGTMVVFLPSYHEGGNIELSHHEKVERLSAAQTSAIEYSWICWHSDVETSFAPISSGFRLQLVYSLHLFNSQPTLSASGGTEGSRKFKSALAKWKALYDKTGCPHLLVYALLESEEYGWESPTMLDIKEHDWYRVQFLKQHAREEGFTVFLAVMICSIDILGEKEIGLETIVDLDGNVVATRVELTERDIIQPDVFQYRDPNDMDIDDDADGKDNDDDFSDPEKEYHYRDWVVLMIPENYRLQFLVNHGSSLEINHWIAQLLEELSSQIQDFTEDEGLGEKTAELACLCRHALKLIKPRVPQWDDLSFAYERHRAESKGPRENIFIGPQENIIHSAILLKDEPLFLSALSFEPLELPLRLFHDLGCKMDIASFDMYERGLETVFLRLESIPDRNAILQSFLSGYESRNEAAAKNDFLKAWVQTRSRAS